MNQDSVDSDHGGDEGSGGVPMRRLLTEREVCELLSVGRTTLRSLSLRPVHVNRCVRYVSTDVGEYIDQLGRSDGDGGGSSVGQPPLPFGDDGRLGGDAA